MPHEYNDVVEALVSNPSEVPDLLALAGLLGRSNRRGYSRVYLTIDLCDYVEIADDDIVHTVALDTKTSPLGVNTVWIRRDAKFIRTNLQTQDHQGASREWTEIPIGGPGGSACKYFVDKYRL